MSLTIEQATAPNEEIRDLLSELDQALSGFYAPEQQHALSIDQLFEPEVRFFVARLDRDAAGCGGVALLDDYAELKRMYVRSRVRGRGVADAIFGRVEDEARAAGRGPLRLETGTHQVEAIRFYEKMGFRRCPPFGPYAEMPPETVEASLFFEKDL